MIKKIQENLFSSFFCNFDKDFGGFHVDNLEGNIYKQSKKEIIEKSLNIFIQTYIQAQALQIPAEIFLIFFLGDKSKNIHLNLNNKKSFIKELHNNTPPEIILSYYNNYNKEELNKIIYLNNRIWNNKLDLYLRSGFDKNSNVYYKTLYVFISKKLLFRFMIKNLYFKKNLSLNHFDHEISKKNISYLEELKNKLLIKDTSENLTNLGALLLLAFNNPEEAIENLKNAIKLDNKNNTARFWLATCQYYYYDDIEKAENILQESLNYGNNNFCLMLLSQIILFKTKDLKQASMYLKIVIDQEPNWLLPYIRLNILLECLDQKSEANQILYKALLIDNFEKNDNNIIGKYLNEYIIGNNINNKKLIKSFIKTNAVNIKI